MSSDRGQTIDGETRRPKTTATGVAFGESAQWHQGRIWFCDWISREVISVFREGGDRPAHTTTQGAPTCIDWRPDDTLLAIDGGNQQLPENEGTDGLHLVADPRDLRPDLE